MTASAEIRSAHFNADIDPPTPGASWGLSNRRAASLDQILSSSSNFALLFLVGRLAGTEAVGNVSLALITVVGALALTRAMVGDPLLVHRPSTIGRNAPRSTVTAGAFATAALIGAVATLLCIGLAIATQGQLAQAYLVAAVASPVVCIQDSVRFYVISDVRAHRALISDAIWLAVLLVGVFSIDAMDKLDAPSALAAWTAGCAAGLAASRSDLTLRPVETRAWISQTRHIGPWLAAAVGLGVAQAQAQTYVTAATGGVALLGALRAFQSMTNPVAVILAALLRVRLPEWAELATSGRLDEVRKPARIWRAGVLGVGLPVTVVIFANQRTLVTALFGEDFTYYAPVLSACVLATVLLAASFPDGMQLRARHAGRPLVAVQCLSATVGLGLLVALGQEWPVGAVVLSVVLQSATLSLSSHIANCIVRSTQLSESSA